MWSYERIGPHNIDIISLIVGSTLGDTHLERRRKGKGTRIIFEQCNKNVEYLMWFHKYLSDRGYCNKIKPVLRRRVRKNGEIFFHYRINSYTFSSFN
jgi:ubiquinol-cytochrome c reductase cytochrome b subunit